MLTALLLALLYCCVVLVVAWVIIAILGMVPVPPPISGLLPTIVWAIALIACLVILIRAVAGVPPLLMVGL